jgi:colanic acid biosynthesis glycosyl transferase WcaI
VVPCVPNYPSGAFFEGYGNGVGREEEWHGVRIHRARTIPRGNSKLQLIANYTLYPFSALWRISRTAAKRADVSFVSMPSPLFQAFAGIWARWAWGIPTVYWVQDLWPETVQYLFNIKDGPFLRTLDRVCGWLYRKADIVMVQSPAMIPLVARHGVPAERIRVLHNTASPFYRPVDPASEPDIAALMPAKPFKLLFAGNIGESQGLEVLVEAADRLRHRDDIGYVVVGSGRGMAALEAKIAELGLADSFTFCGRHPEERMPAFFAQADALFVSLRDLPNFALTLPYKVQTYLACAKPVVASIAGEGARVIESARAGFACAPEDPAALAEIIARMADLPREERDALGDSARAYFNANYAAPVVYGTLELALADAAAMRSKAHG